MKIIKKLGSGMFGTAYLVEKDGEKYALKIQKILPEHTKKSYKYELWRELDLYNYINKLNDNDSKFFTKLYDYEIYDNCKHKQNRPFKLANDNFSNKLKKLDLSKSCVNFLLEYKGSTTLHEFLSTKNVDKKLIRSFILQIIKMTQILKKGGYMHGDLHTGNIMITKTRDKYFMFNKTLKVPYYGYRLSAIDYGEVLHKKYNLKKEDRYKYFIKNTNKMIYDELYTIVNNIVTNFDKYIYVCKKLKKSTPFEKNKDMFNILLRSILNKHRNFWNKTKNKYSKTIKLKKMFEIIENSNDNIGKIINDNSNNKKIYTDDIWKILSIIAMSFRIHHPKLYSKYFGWCSYHKLNLSKKNVLKLLDINNMNELVNYFVKLK